ncbi:TPR domain protein in aerotolerance operon [Vibrio ishigakensis]|uniref:TPR domain protein in aerotolerance operon n=1 Tax=Vibrio ishigakensis TaxID=1481914 RepID=A0A0B8PG20_9VIBR|nr:TPR domain protein in aerotolerance operon [Vibrio ishigakensis]
MPVTKDRALAAYFLDALEPNLLPEKTSKPDAVLKPIDKLLSQSKAPSTVLIVTDKTEPEAIEAFEQKFTDLKHQIVVWAIGESGLSQSELTQLETLAKSGNGSLVQFTHDDSDVKSVNSEIENNLFAVQDNDQPWHDSGYWLLFLILPIQLMWFRRGWTLQW